MNSFDKAAWLGGNRFNKRETAHLTGPPSLCHSMERHNFLATCSKLHIYHIMSNSAKSMLETDNKSNSIFQGFVFLSFVSLENKYVFFNYQLSSVEMTHTALKLSS